MKKITAILGVLFLAIILLTRCQKLPEVTKSSNCSITAANAAYLTNATTGTFSATNAGVISGTNITFTYTGTAATAVDITKMRLYVTVSNSAVITPSLTGLKDMTTPLTITVTASDGTTQQYTITVVKK